MTARRDRVLRGPHGALPMLSIIISFEPIVPLLGHRASADSLKSIATNGDKRESTPVPEGHGDSALSASRE